MHCYMIAFIPYSLYINILLRWHYDDYEILTSNLNRHCLFAYVCCTHKLPIISPWFKGVNSEVNRSSDADYALPGGFGDVDGMKYPKDGPVAFSPYTYFVEWSAR